MPKPVDHVEAMRHLSGDGALSGLDFTDTEGMMIRAAADLWGTSQTPPLHGNAALRAIVKEYLTSIGYLPVETDGPEGAD